MGWLSVGVGDTLITYDWSLGRFSVFSDDGLFIRQFLAPTQSNRPVGALTSSMLVTRSEKPVGFNSKAGVGQDTVDLLVVDAAKSSSARIGKFLGSEYLVSRTARSMSVSDLPFGTELVVATHRMHVYVGTSNRAEIAVMRHDGKILRLVRWNTIPAPVTPADIDVYISDRSAEFSPGELRDRMRAQFEQAPFPTSKPLFSGLLISDDGSMWVRRFSATSHSVATVFDVFDSTGRSLGSVDMPTGFQPTQIAPDFTIGTWKDVDDLPHVRLYRLRPRRD